MFVLNYFCQLAVVTRAGSKYTTSAPHWTGGIWNALLVLLVIGAVIAFLLFLLSFGYKQRRKYPPKR
jgi:hypothetical protein